MIDRNGVGMIVTHVLSPAPESGPLSERVRQHDRRRVGTAVDRVAQRCVELALDVERGRRHPHVGRDVQAERDRQRSPAPTRPSAVLQLFFTCTPRPLVTSPTVPADGVKVEQLGVAENSARGHSAARMLLSLCVLTTAPPTSNVTVPPLPNRCSRSWPGDTEDRRTAPDQHSRPFEAPTNAAAPTNIAGRSDNAATPFYPCSTWRPSRPVSSAALSIDSPTTPDTIASSSMLTTCGHRRVAQ